MALDLDRLVPESIRAEGGDAIRRARVVVVTNAIVAFVAAYITWVQYRYGSVDIAVATGVLTLLAIVSQPALFLSGAWRLIGGLTSAMIFAIAGSVIAATGGAMPAANFYLCLVPLVTTLVLGARWGAASAVLAMVFLTVVEMMRREGFEFPLQVSADVAAESRYRGAVLFELILFVFAVVYDSLRTFSIRDVAESEARYRAFSAGGTDLLFELDDDGQVKFVSQEHCWSLGWKIDDVMGSRIVLFVHPDDAAGFSARLAEAEKTGSFQGVPARIRVGDGTWRWFEPAFTSYETPDGPRRTIVVARDLTERLEMETRLRQSQKMDAIGQLAGGVAHDFNNLLMVVSSYGEILSRRLPEGSKEQAAAKQILQAAEHGEGLTRQLRAVGRSTATEPEPVELNDVVAALESMLHRVAGDAVSLEMHLAPDLSPVLADKGQIEQILVNLVLNARDALPDGGTVRIETSRESNRIRLRVGDDGMGMDEATRERVFEAFFTTKQRQEGTGLGLYVVYSLVRGMDGDVRIDSEPGVGTTVTIELPARRDLSVVQRVAAESTSDVPGGDETLLVVEDRKAVRELVQQALQGVGYAVVVASTGVEGLAAARARSGEIDLVLSDVVMPEMSGPEMAREIRVEWPGTRFLFMSGHPEEAEALAKKLSDAEILMKPILPTELCRRVRAALDTPR